MDSAPLFSFPLMFTESPCLRSITVSVYIPLPFFLRIFPTEAESHIDLISFDCGSSGFYFSIFSTSKKTAGLIKAIAGAERKHRRNQSDGVILDEMI